jgi:hypothetical protein
MKRARFKIKATCFWCGRELTDFTGHCGCVERYKMTAEEIRVGMALSAAEFCDHFCCGLPAQICRARGLVRALEDKP